MRHHARTLRLRDEPLRERGWEELEVGATKPESGCFGEHRSRIDRHDFQAPKPLRKRLRGLLCASKKGTVIADMLGKRLVLLGRLLVDAKLRRAKPLHWLAGGSPQMAKGGLQIVLKEGGAFKVNTIMKVVVAGNFMAVLCDARDKLWCVLSDDPGAKESRSGIAVSREKRVDHLVGAREGFNAQWASYPQAKITAKIMGKILKINAKEELTHVSNSREMT